MDYYSVLDLASDCSDEDVKAQYRRLARTHHPDVNPGDAEAATARLRAINEAYEILSDPIKRRVYDLTVDKPSMRTASKQPPTDNSPHPGAAPAPDVPRWNPYVGAVADARKRTERRTAFAAVLAGVFLVLMLSRTHVGPSIIIPNHEVTDSGSGPAGDTVPIQDPDSVETSEEAKSSIVSSLRRTLERMRPQVSEIISSGRQVLKSSNPSTDDGNRQAELSRLTEDLAALQKANDVTESDLQEAQSLEIGPLRQSISRYRDDLEAVRTAGGNSARDIRDLSPPGVDH